MNPWSVLLTMHLFVGLSMGLYCLRMIRAGFSNYDNFLTSFKNNEGDSVYIRLISTPYSFVALFTLLGFLGLIAWLMKD